MSSSTSLQFGPEWMRNKQQTLASATRPPPSLLSPTLPSTSPPAPGASSYSSLLTPAPHAPPERQHSDNPFLYTREELLQVWKDGGGRGGLGLEVELWEGVVRELGGEPIGLKEMSEGEKKLFSLPLNSDLRRRQSHDFLPNLSLSTDRPKHSHPNSSAHSPLGQQRFGALLARKRKDDATDAGPPLSLPRRLSLSALSSPLGGPLSPTAGGMPSPRSRLGSGSHGFDGSTSAGDGSWRKREADSARGGILGDGHAVEERDEEAGADGNTSSDNPNGSLSDADMSRSISGRSMAPSPPSFREDSGMRLGSAEGVTATLSGLALHEEGKKPTDTSDVRTNTADTGAITIIRSGITAARPPGLENDPSNVSWSYRDPKGNIQGPFTATLMQKWYDEGYFTSDLLMKRTHLDTDWTPVGELSIRAGGDKLFLSSFSESGPPGLAPHPPTPSMDGQSFDRTGQPLGQISLQRPHHSEPYPNGSHLSHFRNPVSTRPSALDSFLASSSNSSHSPASSFGAAGLAPMPTASPDPPFGIPGSRASFGNNVAEPAFPGRVSSFEQQSPSMTSRPGIVGFGATGDSLYGPRLASLTQRGSTFEAQGLNSLTNSVAAASPWATGGTPRRHDPEGLGDIHTTSMANAGFSNSSVTNIPGFGELGGQDPPQFGSDAYNISKAGFSQQGRGELSAEPLASGFGRIGLGGLRDQGLRPLQDLEVAPINAQRGVDEGSLTPGFGNGFGSIPPSTAHGQGAMFGVHGSQQALSQHLPSQHLQHSLQNLPPTSTFDQFPATPAASSPGHIIQPPQLQQQSTAKTPANQPPWSHPSTQPHPHFDSPHPSSSNVMQTPVPVSDISSYDTQQTQSEPSDWTSMPDHAEGLAEARSSPASKGAEAGQVQQTAWNPLPKTSQTPVDRSTVQGLTAPAPLPSPKTRAHEPPRLPSAKKRVSSSQPSQSAPPKPSVAPAIVPTASVPQPPSPHPATSVQPKPAWSTPVISADDEAKATKQAGLREIQEAEAKRVEARKLVEREKERAARAHPAHPQEETQTFTTSWGLPTSQAGTARATPKEPAPVAATPSPSVTPVWTNAAKPQQVKRTMKEIQEEEERRKKASSKEKETAAAASRRAYADFANKATPAVLTGGGWTTVGSGGKPSSAPSTPRQVPGSGSSSSSPQTTTRVANGAPARASPASSQTGKASASRPATAEEGPVPPSPDFMKWLREAVRGFNAGFNTEEFMAMLLTFSLDFPPSTIEVIQDMVYMNSATLDGRRFAADFCAKRKADAANRPKGWGTTGGKQPSLADVVKTQPKPAQSELPFKMVKKKGRGNAVR